jgi:deoxyadenosine/deoxycytidine kinase
MTLPAHIQTQDLPRYIVIEGPIGVGKTTLVKRLGAMLDARTVLEVFEENPFLADFYKDNARFAFQTEMFFLLSRYQQQQQFSQEDLFSRFSISDYLFRKCRIFASMTLSEDEFRLFDRVYEILDDSLPRPDLVIYLHAPVDVLMERIQRRGRPYERDLDRAYLSDLQARYTDLFSGYRETPLLMIDTSELDFAHDDAAVLRLLQEMTRPNPGRREL